MLEPQDEIVYLVRQAKVGNQLAFACLVQHYESELCGYVASVLRDPDEAQDCTQRVFFKAWKKLHMLKDDECFKPWLYSIVKHEMLDYLRKKRKVQLSSWEDLEEYMVSPSSAHLEEMTAEAELFYLALAELPPKLRRCLHLDIQGYSHAEIALELKIGLDSVNTYLRMSRLKFREAYSHLEKEGSAFKIEGEHVKAKMKERDQWPELSSKSPSSGESIQSPARNLELVEVGMVEGETKDQPGINVERSESVTRRIMYVDQLQEPYQTPVRLHYLKKHSSAEIAAQLGRAKGTIKSQISRGMQMLSQIMEQRTEERDSNRLPSVGGKRMQSLEEIAMYVDQLQEPYQTPVRLHYLKKHSSAEIAAQLGRAKGTIKSQISRGMQMLERMRLEEDL